MASPCSWRVGLAALLQAFVIKPYLIPSESMATTLEIGQRVLVDRVTYHLREIERGDVIVFHEPERAAARPAPGAIEGDVLIKRVIGLPGDTLSLSDGRVLVDGVALDEPYVRSASAASRRRPNRRPRSGLGSAALVIGSAVHRPRRRYFVMGDNRPDSYDSRYWGPSRRRTSSGTPSSPTGRRRVSGACDRTGEIRDL